MISSSTYFEPLLGPNFKEGQEEEVTIPKIDGPTLKAIIDFCYSGIIRITDENVAEIISAASFMALELIEEKCAQFWSEKLAASNCLEIFLLADKYSYKDLLEESMDLICEKFEEVDIHEGVQELKFEHFRKILECDKIHALEKLVFQCFVAWVNYDDDEENRVKYAPELFSLIRLAKIPQPVGEYK